MMTKAWEPLQHGDWIQIVAPASKPPSSQWETPHYWEQIKHDLFLTKQFFQSWGLHVKISPHLLENNATFPSLANTDELRFADLYEALVDPKIKAVMCLRGGYGSIRLLERFRAIVPPEGPAKAFIGFSDITLLLLYLRQKWQWNVIHAPMALRLAKAEVASEDAEQLKKMLFGEIVETAITDLIPLNHCASVPRMCVSTMIGGNLTLISRTFGLSKQGEQIEIAGKILFIEDVSEPFRRVDGILQQMQLAGFFDAPAPTAIVIGNFSMSDAQEQLQIQHAFKEFAARMDVLNIPVLHCNNIGHEKNNHPIPIGPEAILQLGEQPTLTIKSGAEIKKAKLIF